MKIVLLDACTANPGDVSWAPFEALGECAIYDRTPVAETVERCRDAEVVITNKAVLSQEILSALPHLRYIGVIATGYNVVDVAAAAARGIVVTNVPGYSTPSVAQAVFGLILELATHTALHAQTVREGRWAKCPDFCYWEKPIFELNGRTLGLVGLGDIGSAVARIGIAFGMKVLAARRTWAVAPPAGIRAASIDEVFQEADVVSLHCPLTGDTQHLVNAARLNQMKSSALLINTSRGPLVDEAALAEALNAGRIAGAGLDVLAQEPPQSDNPLLTARNCLITPHVAWASRESRIRLINAAAANLQAFLDGHPCHVVNGVAP